MLKPAFEINPMTSLRSISLNEDVWQLKCLLGWWFVAIPLQFVTASVLAMTLSTFPFHSLCRGQHDPIASLFCDSLDLDFNYIHQSYRVTAIALTIAILSFFVHILQQILFYHRRCSRLFNLCLDSTRLLLWTAIMALASAYLAVHNPRPAAMVLIVVMWIHSLAASVSSRTIYYRYHEREGAWERALEGLTNGMKARKASQDLPPPAYDEIDRESGMPLLEQDPV